MNKSLSVITNATQLGQVVWGLQGDKVSGETGETFFQSEEQVYSLASANNRLVEEFLT